MTAVLEDLTAIRRSAMDLLARREHGRVERYIRNRARSGYGPLRIREELNQRGLARGDIEQALRESDINWQEQLKEAWQRKFSGCMPEDPKERARQGRFLSYRGYSLEMIGRLLSGRELDD